MPHRTLVTAPRVMCLALLGCVGRMDDGVESQNASLPAGTPGGVKGGGPGATTGDPGVRGPTAGAASGEGSSGSSTACSAPIARPPWQLATLTAFAVRTIVGQVFGAATLADPQVEAMLDSFPSALRLKGFDTEEKAVAAQWVDAYVVLVARLSALAAEKATVRGAIETFAGKSCGQTLDLEAACGADLTRKLASALWRRPADADSEASLGGILATYKTNKGKYDASRAYAAAVASLLLSARSALRVDSAELTRTGALDAFTLGARLALTIASSLPDALLRARMEDGTLARPDVLRSEARRVLRTPEGRATLRHFAEQWLNLSLVKSPPGAPGYVASKDESERVADAAREEIGRLFEDVALDKGGRLPDFFSTNDVVPAHDWLAKQYGTARASRVVPAGATDRRGILARVGFSLHGAFGDFLPLAHRGYGVTVTMLCGTIGALPDNIDATLPASAPDVLSSRQFFETLTDKGSCAVCHAKFNKYGYALSGLAVTGARLVQERVKNRKTMQAADAAIDESTRVTLDGVERAVSGPAGLSEVIGRSNQAQACFTHRFAEYAVGVREPFLCAEDGPSRPPAAAGTLEETILAYLTSKAFAAR